MTKRPFLACAAVGLAVLGACGSKSNSGSNTASDDTTATTAAASATTAAASTADATTADANTASQAELVAALEAHNVPNASRWAREIEEYRPYPTSDASLQKLKDNLAKYNPGTDVLNAIIGSLHV